MANFESRVGVVLQRELRCVGTAFNPFVILNGGAPLVSYLLKTMHDK